MKRTTTQLAFALCLICIGVVVAQTVGPNAADRTTTPSPDRTAPALDHLRIARLEFADQRSECFNDRFMAMLRRDSFVETEPRLAVVKLADDALYDFPFVVMSGKGEVSFTEAERASLKRYLQAGGFVLASNTCADPEFDRAFRDLLADLFPDDTLRPMSADHPAMTSLYDVKRVRTVRVTDQPLWMLELDGRLALVYSPVDLRDADQGGPDCCCCGANDIANAHLINANVLLHVLMGE